MIEKININKVVFNIGMNILLISVLTLIFFPLILLASSDCPQPRKTIAAPEEFLNYFSPYRLFECDLGWFQPISIYEVIK